MSSRRGFGTRKGARPPDADNAAMPPVRRSLLVLALAAAGACRAVPEDHELARKLGRSFQKVLRHVRPDVALDAMTRRVGRIARDSSDLVAAQPRQASRLVRNATRSVESLVDETIRLPGTVTGAVESGGRSGLSRTQTLARTVTTLLSPAFVGQTLGDKRRNVEGTITTLLARPIFADPTDDERVTEVRPTRRRPSLFEKLLKQLPF